MRKVKWSLYTSSYVGWTDERTNYQLNLLKIVGRKKSKDAHLERCRKSGPNASCRYAISKHLFSTENLKVNGKNKIHPTNEKTVPSSSLCVCFSNNCTKRIATTAFLISAVKQCHVHKSILRIVYYHSVSLHACTVYSGSRKHSYTFFRIYITCVIRNVKKSHYHTIMATIQIQLLPNYRNYRNRINFERL